MIDYKKMYTLMCGAVSDSLDILSGDLNTNSINSVRFLLQEAMISAEHVYVITAKGDYDFEAQDE